MIILVLFVVVSAVVSVEGLQVSVVSAEEAIVKSERNEEKKGLKATTERGDFLEGKGVFIGFIVCGFTKLSLY